MVGNTSENTYSDNTLLSRLDQALAKIEDFFSFLAAIVILALMLFGTLNAIFRKGPKVLTAIFESFDISIVIHSFPIWGYTDLVQLFMVAFAFGCAPLEDRVELFDVEWCADARLEPAACIVDGDTFDLATCAETNAVDSERVRMLGVDAPEVAHGDEPADCYGAEASD